MASIFRFRLQDATGADVGEELSYRIEGEVRRKAFAKTGLRAFTKADADSLRSELSPALRSCSRLVVPIPLGAAGTRGGRLRA